MVSPENSGGRESGMIASGGHAQVGNRAQNAVLNTQAPAAPPVSQQLINTMTRNNEEMSQLLARLHNFLHAFKGVSPELRIQEPSTGERVTSAGVFNVMGEHMAEWDKRVDDLGTLVEELEKL